MQERQEIVYYDRYARERKPEGIFGEKPLRWAYETGLGRFFLETAIKRKWFSGLYGKWADFPCSAREIPGFIERFGVDTSEFLETPETFRTFNEFFFRRLKPEARPIAPAQDAICFPADGRHLYIPDLSCAGPIYAKGRKVNLPELLGDQQLADSYATGSAVLSRLCPTDYHRFHFPAAGFNGTARLINGSLFSVNPIALGRNLAFLWENKRQVTRVTNSTAGDYLFLEVGATNVGSIVDTASPESEIQKGEEKGYFRFGGSMVITIFSQGRFLPADDLRDQSSEGIELYAKMGDRMGTAGT